jgi:serine/threonine protein kinase/cephalosporin-C deacetylase-like acetyl esterase
MNQARWRQIERLCHEALERESSGRAAFLDEACAGDADLRREVESLIAQESAGRDFLEAPTAPQGEGVALAPGARLGPYEIVALIGAGGMGEVYKARDTRLDRTVAIKVLPPMLAADPERRARLQREAKTIAGLNHPHICTLHDVGHQRGAMFLVMEHVAGESLAERLRKGPLPLAQAVAVAMEIADALAAAHREGVIHRDLKPANVMVTPEGHVKVLDFGLAKHLGARFDSEVETATAGAPSDEASLTQKGAVVGTLCYLSPEQVEGKPLDARSDIFAFGSLLYELLTGRRAFQGDSRIATMSAIVRDTPVRAGELRAGVSDALGAIVNRCLEKNRDARYASAAEVYDDLAGCRSDLASRRPAILALAGKPWFVIPGAAFVAILLATVSWQAWRSSRVHWARTVALPEVKRLIDEQRSCAAFRLVEKVESYLPHDPEIARIRQNFMRRVSFHTDPPGADIYLRDYLDTAADAPWDHVGRTPLEERLIPAGHLRYRITEPGLSSVEGDIAGSLTGGLSVLSVKLDAEESVPPGMVRVPAQKPIEGFWLDKFEVTNRRFKEFIVQGGYQKREYWKHPFVNAGRPLRREEAMGQFRDATGRPGPASWQFGTFPDGQDEHPVGGVSWHEAAACCEFEGKALPTVHHWRRAATVANFATILEVSNFAGQGPAPVGRHGGLGPFGTYDTAGNVREWCWNASGEKRYILGGAWDDPKYLFYMPDARLPFDRSVGNGFRCVKYEDQPPDELSRPVDSLRLSERRVAQPASDEVFAVYRSIHAYDRGELEAKVEATDDTPPYWRQEKVSFRAAYGNERVTAYLFLPRNADPPLQTVVTFPGNYALDIRSSARLETQWFDYIVRSGRAVMHPIYKGTYERTIGGSFAAYWPQPRVWRDLALQWHKDLGRSIDYLETRREFDREKLAYHGISLGAAQGPRLMALEPRLKLGLLIWGGFVYWAQDEVLPLHFASRSKAPTLMVNGRFDPIFPFETSQIPMFRLLGAADRDKRHFVVDGGHPAFNQEVVREVLGWLDRYLGPVDTR